MKREIERLKREIKGLKRNISFLVVLHDKGKYFVRDEEGNRVALSPGELEAMKREHDYVIIVDLV